MERSERDLRYLNRETSWLDFNHRVLEIAIDPSTPLLERVRFLAITHSNLDEFFQVRVAGLLHLLKRGYASRTADGKTATQQLSEIRESVDAIYKRTTELFTHKLLPALEAQDIHICSWEDLDEDDKDWLVDVFRRQVFPIVTPLAVDPSHPFPYISNLSLNLAVFVREPGSASTKFARVKVPPILPRFVSLPDGERFVTLESVIAEHLDELFPGMEIVAHYPFRVTRDADFDVDSDADDLREAVESALLGKRFGRVVRLEVEPDMSSETLELLMRELDITEHDVYSVASPLAMTGLHAVSELDRSDLRWSLAKGTTQSDLANANDIFELIRTRDILVHHPYESFDTSVNRFIHQAARDPKVLAIRMSLYRTSKDTPIIGELVAAAEAGKQVVALIELKARFDEQANLEWAQRLEEAGVHVQYGKVGLKCHCKTTLVVRQESDCLRRYVHIGTGNYNEFTSTYYEDVGLFTSDPDIGADIGDLFNYLTGYSRQSEYRELLVAPLQMRDRMVKMIREEAAHVDGRIVMKMNSLVDPEIIDELYSASQSETRIDLIVRGICCLRPGVPGLSENIKVRSIIGRNLEHSRIYRFGTNERGRTYLIGSADMMPRNLNSRVEAIVPVKDPKLKDRLEDILDTLREDTALAWTLAPDGTWTKLENTSGLDSHIRLAEKAESMNASGRNK